MLTIILLVCKMLVFIVFFSLLLKASVTIVLEYLMNWLGEKAFTSELVSLE